jgi:serine/threonine protein kinase
VRDLHLERIVALKVLEPVLTREPAAVERFRREAQLAARLRHPNVVDIYEIGGRYGLIWYTMELVEGPNLAQLVERGGGLPREHVLQILREGLSALAEAHAAGLVHRDIKPENMLLDSTGSLKITDFGLALALRGAGRFGGATSQSGTPQFASPEQLLARRSTSAPISTACRLWRTTCCWGGRPSPAATSRRSSPSRPRTGSRICSPPGPTWGNRWRACWSGRCGPIRSSATPAPTSSTRP